MRTLVVHLMSDDPFIAEVEDMPRPTDSCLLCFNPRLRDGKPLRNMTQGMTGVVFPWHRISFVEIMGSDEERKEIVEFFRPS